MNTLAILVAYLLFFASLIFVLLLGQSSYFRNGPVGKVHRWLTETIPHVFVSNCRRIIGQGNMVRLEKCWFYCCDSRNPTLQIFFLALITGCLVLFFQNAWSNIPNIYLSSFHQILIPLDIIFLYGSFYVACAADSGVITQANVARMTEIYPYDYLLYEPKECRTCKFPKPARSKHCSLCKACVARSDHHCAWVNTCVGANNHRYFLLFLFAVVQLCAYGTYLCFQIYRAKFIEFELDKAYIVDRRTGTKRELGLRYKMLYTLQRERAVGALLLLASLICIVMLIFLFYQLYLVARGMTTNEAFKWEDLTDAVARGELYVIEPEEESKGTGKAKGKKGKGKKYKEVVFRDHGGQEVDETTVGMATGRREGEGRRRVEKEEGRRVERKIGSLAEVENLYDRGIIGNFKEVLFPRGLN